MAVLEGLVHLLGLDWVPKSKRTAFGQPASYFVNRWGGEVELLKDLQEVISVLAKRFGLDLLIIFTCNLWVHTTYTDMYNIITHSSLKYKYVRVLGQQ